MTMMAANNFVLVKEFMLREWLLNEMDHLFCCCCHLMSEKLSFQDLLQGQRKISLGLWTAFVIEPEFLVSS